MVAICVAQADHGINAAGGFPAVFFLCRESCLLLRHIFIIFLGATAFFWSLLINKKKILLCRTLKNYVEISGKVVFKQYWQADERGKLKVKHIVQFSGGAASAYVAWLVVQEFCKENTILLFHDTKAEHPDAERFRKQVSEFIGVPITEVSDGRDLWEVIKDNHCLPSSFIPFCTRVLKQEPAEAFYKEFDEQGIEYMLYNGLGPEEWPRVQRSIVRGEVAGRTVRCLLAERQISNVEVKKIIRDEWKICLPEPYMHLKHNNCIPCFKAGKGHFYKVWQNYPLEFAKAVQMEELIGHTVFKYKSLAELAKHWEQQDINQPLDFGDEGLPCVCSA